MPFRKVGVSGGSLVANIVPVVFKAFQFVGTGTVGAGRAKHEPDVEACQSDSGLPQDTEQEDEDEGATD